MKEDGEGDRFVLVITEQNFRRGARTEETLAKNLFGHNGFLKQPFILRQLPDEPGNDGNVRLGRFSNLKTHSTVTCVRSFDALFRLTS